MESHQRFSPTSSSQFPGTARPDLVSSDLLVSGRRQERPEGRRFFHRSQIYKATCKGFNERIFDDLIALITEHCQHLKLAFDESVRDSSLLFADHRAAFSERNTLTIVLDMQR